MGSLQVSIPHQLGQQEVLHRAQGFVDALQTQYAIFIKDVHGQWVDNRLAFKFNVGHSPIEGTLVVEDQRLVVTTSLPLAAALFRGTKVE
ncbi:MAG: polyhydroxyalkanoic acid system family protein [Pirellulaceae bacterium]